ncbi:MAG: 50S ribosomal protein L2 [Sediminibacterium sp. Gen4]|jgi:large subunit ribosomal protein L2|uniref:Large ribosomal subunit protein uL2 n=1 Tax=Sediminibacterium sp. KACHI17 TaxID=1751071 RepID=A0AAT9GF10_9BACT|nr:MULTISPECIES: 50S ribosomal protein L2 [unclassified Sediminibacterium]MBL0881741.1 50S ribosomal protein L2 [Chitinophagaceae bacterium]MBW0162548.1 50S ribosomal protein L2 [Sediminibacterium sp.]MBW0164083.1 50S ribosomal protein L2 [Sediminibacterium sp.]MDZ4071131.1 50S ribosomal protein L2 [Sediminibacterium sp.]NWK67183.1 50S ribosomal protein L2 [Sediminibacterium sp. Gen4]
MALKKYKPMTAGTRWRIGNAYAEITTNKPEKSLLEPQKKTAGRNSQGRRAMRYMGGGSKQHYRIIDFKRNKRDIAATVVSIEYDPNRTAFIALVQYTDGEKRYIIAPQGIQVGANIIAGDEVAPEIGNALMMKNMPLGTMIHNIELQPGQGGKMVRSAGASAQLANKEEKYAVLKMPSGELRKVLINCYATVGVVSNSDHNLETAGKAGKNRWKGIRPRVRGVAMNPVDHPMGGGEGKASGGHPRSRTGKYAKGEKTRTKGKGSDKLIIQRRDGKKLAK